MASIIMINLELYTTDERWQVILAMRLVRDKIFRGFGGNNIYVQYACSGCDFP